MKQGCTFGDFLTVLELKSFFTGKWCGARKFAMYSWGLKFEWYREGESGQSVQMGLNIKGGTFRDKKLASTGKLINN